MTFFVLVGVAVLSVGVYTLAKRPDKNKHFYEVTYKGDPVTYKGEQVYYTDKGKKN